MKIGIVKEIINGENKVILTPKSIEKIIDSGHQVLFQTNAGKNAGFDDYQYEKVGAKIMKKAIDVWSNADLILKINPLQKTEYKFVKNNQIIWSFLNLSNNPDVLRILLNKKCIAIANELISQNGEYPISLPIEELKGRHAALIASTLLEKNQNNIGMGITTGKLFGNENNANFVILNVSIAGFEAAKIILAIGGNVTFLENNTELAKELKENKELNLLAKTFECKFNVENASFENLENHLKSADVFLATTSNPADLAHKRITSSMISSMKKNAIVIDISIDQGPSFNTIKSTFNKNNQVKVINNVIHYAYNNISSMFCKSASIALSNNLEPFVINLLKTNDIKSELLKNESLLNAIVTYNGNLTNKDIADSLHIKSKNIRKELSNQ